jgi:malate dehydrogenase
MIKGAKLNGLLGTSAWHAVNATLAESIVRDEKKVIPCCVAFEGECGQNDIYIGVSFVVGRHGIEKIVDYKLNAKEQAAFDKSADAVRNMNGVHKELGIL